MVKYKDPVEWASNNLDTLVYRSPRELVEIVWNAACAFQRDRDIEIVQGEAVNIADETDESYNLALQHAAAAIAGQQ